MFRDTYLKDRFFMAIGVVIALLILAYSYPGLMVAGRIVLVSIFIFILFEWFLLYRIAHQLTARRQVFSRLSLGDDQEITYEASNLSRYNLNVEIVDELPYQLQLRNFKFGSRLKSGQVLTYRYVIRPLVRGAYSFGNLHIYASIPLISLIERRITVSADEEVVVIPSIIQMKKYELEIFARTASLSGIRRVRSIGEDDEFEHIRSYQQGDNIRSINWKATSRKNAPMINQFQNTRSQMVYCIIDKGRSMKMPFDGLTLLDYAINTALVISNIVLKKYDRAGLVTFSDKIGKIVAAENTPHQLGFISQHLYNQTTGFKESNYELLFYTLQNQLRRRSVLLFFTNFEHLYDLDRNIEYFKALNRRHLMVIIFFINTELIATGEMKTNKVSDIYLKTFAERTLIEKERILDKLKHLGIQCILTKPENLSIGVINKYLEIKAKRMR
ncbi:MAG: DUF58 domain-containing protein [Saprospiraceae bacterium]|nr:DUF58 domain-containing protein [Saprospiraceae bacterium]